MKKLILLSLILAALPLAAQSPFTFSPVFIGIGPPTAPSVPVPCPPGAIYFRNDATGGIYFCNGTVGAIPQNGVWVLSTQQAQGGGNTTAALTVLGGGQGSGSVVSADGSINCVIAAGVASGTCSASFALGAAVTLTANPSGGSTFNSWSGTSCTAMNCVVVVSAATAVTALFTPPPTLAPISFVQGVVGSSFPAVQNAGDLNVAVISWADNTTTISSLSDAAGNTYSLAKANTIAASGSGWSQPSSACKSGFKASTGLTCTVNVTAGQLEVVDIYTFDNAAVTYTVTDAGGNTWSCNTINRFSGNSDQQTCYSVISNTRAGDVITVTESGASVSGGIFVTPYANGTLPSQATILDASVAKNAGSTTSAMDAGSITTTGSNDIVHVFCDDKGQGSGQVAGTNYTLISGLADNVFAANAEHRLNLSAAAYATPMTGSVATATWQCMATAFQGSAAGAGRSQSIYYAPNIAAAAAGNALSITWSASTPPGLEVKLLEYGGIQASTPLDGTPAGATGSSSAPNSGNVITTSANTLLVGATNLGGTATLTAPAASFSERLAGSGGGDVEDRFPVAAGTYADAPTINQSGSWITQLVGFKGINQSPGGGTNPTLTISCSGTGNGAVASNAGGLACTCTAGVSSGSCSASFASGSNVTLTATPQ